MFIIEECDRAELESLMVTRFGAQSYCLHQAWELSKCSHNKHTLKVRKATATFYAIALELEHIQMSTASSLSGRSTQAGDEGNFCPEIAQLHGSSWNDLTSEELGFWGKRGAYFHEPAGGPS